MKLLEAVANGILWTGAEVPKEARSVLFEAGLLLGAATVASQPDYDNPIGCTVRGLVAFDANDTEIPGPDEYWTQQLTVKSTGCLEGRLNWLAQIAAGFSRIKNAIEISAQQRCLATADDLRDLLIRLNLLVGLSSALRSQDDALALAAVMGTRLENCLELFQSFGVIPPHLIARALWHEKI
jgi:hypothetical protein